MLLAEAVTPRLVIAIDDYAYPAPLVEDDDEVFLKTIIPSRKATGKYLDDWMSRLIEREN